VGLDERLLTLTFDQMKALAPVPPTRGDGWRSLGGRVRGNSAA
jgi:hypothetical protein